LLSHVGVLEHQPDGRVTAYSAASAWQLAIW